MLHLIELIIQIVKKHLDDCFFIVEIYFSKIFEFFENLENCKIFENLEIFEIFDSGTTKISKFSNANKKLLYAEYQMKPFQEYKMIPLDHLPIAQQPVQSQDFLKMCPKVGDFWKNQNFSKMILKQRKIDLKIRTFFHEKKLKI